MEYFYSTFLLMIFTLAGVLFFRKRFEFTLPAVIFAVILIYYGLGLFEKMAYAPLIMAAAGSMLLLYCLIRLIRHKVDRKAVFKLFFTPGLAAFILFCFINLYINYGRVVQYWDELSHWGLITKIMFYTRDFGNHGDYRVFYPGYPPATALFQSFYCWNTLQPGFTDYIMHLAKSVYTYSLVLPFFTLCSWKNWKSCLSIFIISFLFPTVFNMSHYYSLYVDSLLGVLFFHMLFVMITQRRKLWHGNQYLLTGFYLAIGLFVFTLTKASGFGLSIMVLLVIATIVIQEQSASPKSQRIPFRKSLIFLLLPLSGILLGKLSWEWYLTANQINGIAQHTSIATVFHQFFTGDFPAYYRTIIKNFVITFFSGTDPNMVPENNLALWACIFVAAGIYLLNGTSNTDTDLRKSNKTLVYSLALCYTLYVVSLIFSYFTHFDEREAVVLASLERYMVSIHTGIALTLTGAILYSAKQHHSEHMFQKVAAVIVCFVCFLSAYAVYCMVTAPKRIQERIQYQEQFHFYEAYCDDLDPHTAKVWVIAQNSDGYTFHTMHHLALPLQVYNQTFTWSIGEKYGDHDVWTDETLSCEAWAIALQKDNFTHVILIDVDDQFIAQYSSLFNQPSEIKDHTVWAVSQTEEGLRLVLMQSRPAPQ